MFEIEKFISNFLKLPPPIYKDQWRAVYEEMAVHTNKMLPKKIIETQRPNETAEILAYRLCNYRPITFGSMNRALDELYRIISGINYKINAPDDVIQLLTQKKFNNVTFELFLQQCILRKMIEDPNGLLVWLPNGGGLYSKTDRTEPKPYIVNSSDIYYLDDDVLSFLSAEKSEVQVGKKTVYDGNVYYLLTKTQYYKLIQIDLKSQDKYKLELIYDHNIGEIPYCVLGGDMSEYGYFNSYFSPYTAFGNEAICRFTDWQATMVNAAFPFIEEFETECVVTDKEPDKSSNPPDSTEQKYKGQVYTFRSFSKGPHGRIKRKASNPKIDALNPFAEQGLDPSIPSIRFIQANPDTAKYAEESWKGLIVMAEDALHLNLGRGLLSGTAKEIDLAPKETMISKIGNNVFDNIMLSSVIYVDAYLHHTAANHTEISIDKPSTYSIKTEADILNEITILKEKNAPDFFLRASAMDLARKRFSGDRVRQKMFAIMIISNPLWSYSSTEKRDMLMSGGIDKEGYILDINFDFIINSIVQELGVDEFLSIDIDKIEIMIEEKLQEYLPEPTTPIIG